ncbi:NUDIX hydrolase [Microbacterium invictum]|uniref:NUDIX hydrolase n=1 Tax=Microbacterium invictum TaxID=515415 RepID=A0ABZ0V8S2_9MICO|nr:NUDIX hydrolase [Microbacterium invictum]WQB69243.1 NUDIX hydrolase [Microbacterium invictum]
MADHVDSVPLADEPVTPLVAAAERVYTGRVWNVQRDVVRYGDDELIRENVAHPGAAAVVAVDAQDRIVVIQQYRHPIRHRDWEIPAGLLDVEGEPPLETAKRELAEEVDLVAERWDPLVSIFTTPGGNDEVVHLFLARGLSAAPEVHARGEEEADIRVAWVALSDVVDAVIAGRFRNGILATGALAAAEVLRRERAAD